MKSEKNNKLKFDNISEKEEIFTGEVDEEVLNCEGEPCNFVFKQFER